MRTEAVGDTPVSAHFFFFFFFFFFGGLLRRMHRNEQFEFQRFICRRARRTGRWHDQCANQAPIGRPFPAPVQSSPASNRSTALWISVSVPVRLSISVGSGPQIGIQADWMPAVVPGDGGVGDLVVSAEGDLAHFGPHVEAPTPRTQS